MSGTDASPFCLYWPGTHAFHWWLPFDAILASAWPKAPCSCHWSVTLTLYNGPKVLAFATLAAWQQVVSTYYPRLVGPVYSCICHSSVSVKRMHSKHRFIICASDRVVWFVYWSFGVCMQWMLCVCSVCSVWECMSVCMPSCGLSIRTQSLSCILWRSSGCACLGTLCVCVCVLLVWWW